MWYAIYATDNSDSLQPRLAARPAHLARLYALRDEGRLLLAGPLPAIDSDDPGPAGFSGSLIVAEFADLSAARAWADAEHFEFELLSDFWPHGAVAKSFGVFDEKMGIATRGTFIIDKNGVVRWKVVNPIPQARDIAEYQKALAELD